MGFTYKAIINFCCCDYVKKCIFSMINGGRVCYYFLQISYSLFFTISRCSRKPMSAHIPKYFWQKKIIIIFGPKSVQNLAFLIIIVQYIQEQAKWNNLMGIVFGKKKSSARPALITKKMGLVIQSMKKDLNWW